MIDLNGYTREAIQKAMLDRVPRTLDTREGSVIQTALGPAAWYLEGLYMLLGQVQQNAYANTAAGQSLDYICAERGIRRKEAVAARRKGTFNVQIREGALFKTINGADSVLFMCTGKLLEKTDGSYTYEMVCQTAGLAGNSYSGSILPVSAISGLTSAVIGETILSGSDEEDDGSLRARYFETFDVQAFGGNIISYRTAILAVSGVGAVQVYPAWKGGGTVLCSILNSQMKPADSGLLKKVQELICPAEGGRTAVFQWIWHGPHRGGSDDHNGKHAGVKYLMQHPVRGGCGHGGGDIPGACPGKNTGLPGFGLCNLGKSHQGAENRIRGFCICFTDCSGRSGNSGDRQRDGYSDQWIREGSGSDGNCRFTADSRVRDGDDQWRLI